MSKAGQSNIKGIEFQVWAGLSLALQFLRQPGFKQIRLESPNLQDFDVMLENGSKYVCEVKCWKRKFGFADVDAVFNEIRNRATVLEENDNLLIIARSISSELKKRANTARFYRGHITAEIAEWFNKSAEELERLSRVEFWETDLSNSVDVCFSLISELVEAVVSQEDLEWIVHELVVQDFLGGSAQARVISRSVLIERVNAHRKTLFERSGHSALDIEACIKEAKEAAQNPNHRFWKPTELTAASINFSELLVVLKILEQRDDLELAEWHKVWEGLLHTRLTHFIVDSFRRNLRAENFPYITEFLKRWISQLRPFFAYNFHDAEILELITALCNASHALIITLLPLLELFIETMDRKRFFVGGVRDTTYARQKLGECLSSLYSGADNKSRPKIVDFILANFNLVKDEGELWHEVCPAVYDILLTELRSVVDASPEAFEACFLSLAENISAQIDRYYQVKFRLRFKGWEVLGGSSSWSGDNYQVFDHHFVRHVLTPALMYFYEKEPQMAVRTALTICSVTDSRVSRHKPDFLRRCAIPVLLVEYQRNLSDSRCEAFDKICKLMRSKRGIPSKHEIMFQMFSGCADKNLTTPLLQFAISLYDKPLNPFVFKAVVKHAMDGDEWAVQVVTKWLHDGSFGDSMFGWGPLPLLRVLVNRDKMEGATALSGFVQSEYFISKIRDFDVYEWCELVADFILADSNAGIGFLSNLLKQASLPASHQILTFSTMATLAAREQTPASLLELLLTSIIVPLYDNCDWDQVVLAQYVTESYARQELLKVCEQMIKKTNGLCISCIDWIVKIFSAAAKDPSPSLEKAGDQPLGDSRMTSIETVRGRCAWGVQILLHPNLREQLPQVISIIEALLCDKSAYVKRMACIPLAILLDRRNRTVAEDNLPFLSRDIQKATQLRDAIEQMAITFVKEISGSAPKGLFHGLAEVINSMRLAPNALTQQLWRLALQFPQEPRGECIAFGLFQAEFRKPFLDIDEVVNNPMFHHVRSEPDESEFFRLELQRISRNGLNEDRAKLSWFVMNLTDRNETLPASGTDLTHEYEVTFLYFEKLLTKYEKDAFLCAYMFIERNIATRTHECLRLYKKALSAERDALRIAAAGKEKRNLGDLLWAPYSFNGKIICTVANQGMVEEAINLIEFIVDYPKGMSLGMGAELLQFLKSQIEPFSRIKAIFDKLVEHEPLRYSDRDEWIRQAAASGD